MKRNMLKLLAIGIITTALAVLLSGCGKNTLNFGSNDKDLKAGSGTASTNVENLYIEWTAGNVYILYDDVDEIQFEESSKKELANDAKMRYKEEDGSLYISFCKSKAVNNVPDKKLTLVLPNGYGFDNVQFEVVSSDISLPSGFSANSFKLECVSGNIESDGEVDLKDVEINNVSGNAALSVKDLENFEAEVVSGNVQLALPKNTGFTAAIDSVSGDFITDFETRSDDKTYVHGFGSGTTINMSSVSGDLEIKAMMK